MRRYLLFPLLIGLLALVQSSCNTGYRADIQNLISPEALPYLKQSKLIQVTSFDSTGGNKDKIMVPPGKTVTILRAEGPGMIVRIWLAVDSRDPYYLRDIVLRIYWDDESTPSVEAPLGDFFGSGFRYSPYSSQFLGMTSGGFICYFPMPFERSAKIEITNETRRDLDGLLYQVTYHRFEGALESDVAYFHARWNRSIRTDYDSNYVILKTEGMGHLVGVNLNIQSYDGKFSYLEGDEMIYVDGEKRPSVRGTGTEDFFGAAWYFSHGEFATQYSGLIYKDDSLGRISAYRFFSLDPVPFKKNLLVTIEHGHANQEIADYSSMAYWYQMEYRRKIWQFPKAGQRIPLRMVKPARMFEAEKMHFELGGLRSSVVDMSKEGPDWGENKQIVIEARNGSDFRLEINGLYEPRYDVDLFYSRGPDYGNADIFVNGVKAGEIRGYAPLIMPDGLVTLKELTTLTGSVDIRFKITGKDTLSTGYHVGLDGVSLTPKRVYIPDWYLLGPFPNPQRHGEARYGLDTVFLPERYVNMKMKYSGAGKQQITWKYVETPANGLVNLGDSFNQTERIVCYALTYIYSPDSRKTLMFIGSDDGCKVFLNRQERYRVSDERIAEPDQGELELDLVPGWNTLMLKVENNYGAFGFYARVLNPDGKLVFSADKIIPSPEKE